MLHFETTNEVDCLKKCKKSGAVVNPGQCGFAYCAPDPDSVPGKMAPSCEQTGCTRQCKFIWEIFEYPSVSACKMDDAKWSNGAQG